MDQCQFNDVHVMRERGRGRRQKEETETGCLIPKKPDTGDRSLYTGVRGDCEMMPR